MSYVVYTLKYDHIVKEFGLKLVISIHMFRPFLVCVCIFVYGLVNINKYIKSINLLHTYLCVCVLFSAEL